MRIRPRLLVGSLLAAVAVIAVYTWTQWPDDNAEITLTDPRTVVTYPSNGLGNDAVTGEQLPDVALLDSDGGQVSATALVDGPMVINIWYSACAPCATELPEFAAVDAETDEVTFVGVNPQDSAEIMERFAGERGVEYALYRDEGYTFTDDLGVSAFPVTLFVTSDGMIVDQTGALDADELRTKVDDLLTIDEATT